MGDRQGDTRRYAFVDVLQNTTRLLMYSLTYYPPAAPLRSVNVVDNESRGRSLTVRSVTQLVYRPSTCPEPLWSRTSQ